MLKSGGCNLSFVITTHREGEVLGVLERLEPCERSVDVVKIERVKVSLIVVVV